MQAIDETLALIGKSGIPTFVTPMGKGAVDETMPNFNGVYAGTASNPGVQDRVESSDLVLTIGSIKSDFNTAGFSYHISQLKTIDFHSNYIRVRYSEYPGVRMNGVLRKITEQLPKLSITPGPAKTNDVPKQEAETSDPTITHAWLWPTVGQWLQDSDVVITETGTSNFGIWQTRFPPNVTAISQVLWGSIGYATGACQGAALAASEKGLKRTILFSGEGSFQLTAQEVSTMLRNDLRPIIFVIVNKGFTIERLIHGMDAEYNDIQDWRYNLIPEVFGAKEDQAKTYRVDTKEQLQKLFDDAEFSNPDNSKLRFVEVHMARDDAPAELKQIAATTAKRNE
jgi:pyruvate decarboxylase